MELDPKIADPYYNRGKIYIVQNNIMGAPTDCQRALELEPNHRHAQHMKDKLAERGDSIH